MIAISDISTTRLDLVAVTSACALSETTGDGRLGELTRAKVPATWPPEHWEGHVYEWLLQRFVEHPDELGWPRYIALREVDGSRTLIGTVGAYRRAAEPGDCEIGYGLLLEYRGFGYATEAATALMQWVLLRPGVETISAQTFPSLTQSIRVMEKCGMRYVGQGDEEETVRYRWTKTPGKR